LLDEERMRCGMQVLQLMSSIYSFSVA